MSRAQEVRELGAEQALWNAAMTDDAALARAALAAGADMMAVVYTGQSPLWFHAAAQGAAGVLLAMLEAGADTAARLASFSDYTALHFAAYHSRPTAVQVLLAAGADPRAREGYGRTPAECVNGGERYGDLWRERGRETEQILLAAAGGGGAK